MNLFYLILFFSVAHASGWFSSEPDYARWSHAELHTWLEARNIKVPRSFDKQHLYDLVDANWHHLLSPIVEPGRQWTLDQYNRAQRAFEHIRDDSFEKWDESKLRAFLLDQGVVAPSGPREHLVLLAKNKYRTYIDAAAFYSSLASASASSAYSDATDSVRSTTKCISDTAAQASHEVTRAFDDAKDYLYSTWDDHRLKVWLEDRGVVEAKGANTKDELRRLADAYYQKSSSAVWESWSDSYIREWLVAHNLLKPTEKQPRSSLTVEMHKYYYNLTDNVWNTWSNSELKAWLVDHGFLRGADEKKPDELVKMVEEHYPSAVDTIWGAWTDSDIHRWLSEHGYLKSRNDVKRREDLINLINNNYPDTSINFVSYLVWPDARLRAYLRERGIGEDAVPSTRPGLLQETRIRWVQASTRAEGIFARLKDILNNSVEAAEEKVSRVLEVLSGYSRDAVYHASERANDAREYADTKKAHAWSWGSYKKNQARERVAEAQQFVQERDHEAVRRSGVSANWGREKAQGGGDEL